MPTIEFFGYTHDDSLSLMEQAKQQWADLPFHQDIVFVLRPTEQSKVIAWNGSEQPFIRILTRSEERATALRERINDLTDIEVVLIGFFPKPPAP